MSCAVMSQTSARSADVGDAVVLPEILTTTSVKPIALVWTSMLLVPKLLMVYSPPLSTRSTPETFPRTTGRPFGSMVTGPVPVQVAPGVKSTAAQISAAVFIFVVKYGLGSAGVSKLSACGNSMISLWSTAAEPDSVSAVTPLPSTQVPTPFRGDDSEPWTPTCPPMVMLPLVPTFPP